jgi:hypothetical protein
MFWSLYSYAIEFATTLQLIQNVFCAAIGWAFVMFSKKVSVFFTAVYIS